MRDLEIYIHIPFCARKCVYCDFLSAPSDKATMERYVDALKKEIKLNKDKMAGYKISTVFIGGGTPSILDAALICDILDTLRENASISDTAEITIECNPGTVDRKKLLAYKSCGINRISFGLQSADDTELKMLGRIHTYEQFLESYRLARECGFDNINIDLMSALPSQTLDSYADTLDKVIKLSPEHISAYSLIVEEDTEMMNIVRHNPNILPDEDAEREMYYLTGEKLKAAGYDRYEISNYSKPGFECKHNIGYWKRVEYLGFGIGAASLYRHCRMTNTSEICDYLEGFSCEVEHLSGEDEMSEFMFLGLRMIEGVSEREFKSYFGIDINEIFGVKIDKLIEQKLLEKSDDRIYLTSKGIDISNYVMSEFLLD